MLPKLGILLTTRAKTLAYAIVTGNESYSESLFQFILVSPSTARTVSSHGPCPACRTKRTGLGVLLAPLNYERWVIPRTSPWVHSNASRGPSSTTVPRSTGKAAAAPFALEFRALSIRTPRHPTSSTT